MKNKTRERTALALENAAEFIRGHVEAGLSPEDVDEVNEKGLEEYRKACIRASKKILTLMKREINKNERITKNS